MIDDYEDELKQQNEPPPPPKQPPLPWREEVRQLWQSLTRRRDYKQRPLTWWDVFTAVFAAGCLLLLISEC